MKRLRAKDIMSSEVEVIRSTMTVREAATFLIDHEISGAPVEDDSGELVGVLSLTDIARCTAEGGGGLGGGDHAFYRGRWEEVANREDLADVHFEDESRRVGDIMTPVIMAVDTEVSVGLVAQTMLEGHVHRLLVTDDSKVVGIVSSSDLLQLVVHNT